MRTRRSIGKPLAWILAASRDVAWQHIGSTFGKGNGSDSGSSAGVGEMNEGNGEASERISQWMYRTDGESNTGSKFRLDNIGALVWTSENSFKLARCGERMSAIVSMLSISKSTSVSFWIETACREVARR